MCTCINCKEDGIYIIIATKNQENKIEVFLRSCLFKIFYGKEEYIKDVIVTDLCSNDKTREIEERIEFQKGKKGSVPFLPINTKGKRNGK